MKKHLSFLAGIAILAGHIYAGSDPMDYLPDAAAHLGTIVINDNEQFTANPDFHLKIRSALPNTSQMMFSTDDANWSTPEAFKSDTILHVPISVDDFKNMRNTMKTVFVKFGDGSHWSRAVSDSILVTTTTQEIPKILDIWIAQIRPDNFDSGQPSGSERNPFMVPAGSNEGMIDAILHPYTTTYNTYWPEIVNYRPNPAQGSLSTVVTVHIGTGVYQTHGRWKGKGEEYAWGPGHGWRMIGAGKDATTLIMVGVGNGYNAVIAGYGGDTASFDNSEFSDMTLDANLREGNDKSSPRIRIGTNFMGNNMQMRRIRIRGFGSRIFRGEPCAMYGLGYGSYAGRHHYNLIVEDCEIVAPQTNSIYKPVAIGYGGEPDGSGHGTVNGMAYGINLILRNNFVSGFMHDEFDNPVDPKTISMYERITHGIGIEGVKDSIIEDNFVEHAMEGYYVDDLTDTHDIIIRNNHYRDMISGFFFRAESTGLMRFENNLVEFDPTYYSAPREDGQADYGWRTGLHSGRDQWTPYNYQDNELIFINNIFQFNDRLAPDSRLTASLGAFSSFRNIKLENNTMHGVSKYPIFWDNMPEILEKQFDIADPSRLAPLITKNNRFDEDNSIIEVYPYILDRTLPQSVVNEGEAIDFLAPTNLVTGIPSSGSVQGGHFQWTPTVGDAGRYVVSFYDSFPPKEEPRRTLLTIKSPVTVDDPNYFNVGLAAFWKLKEDSGLFLDSTPNGIDINGTNAISNNFITAGVPGHAPGEQAVRFNPRTLDNGAALGAWKDGKLMFTGFQIPHHPFAQGPTDLYHAFTVSFWIRPTVEPAHNEAQLLFSYGGQIFCDMRPGITEGDGKVSILFGHMGGGVDVVTQPDISIGAWHHVAIIYDGFSTKLLVDGVVKAEDAFGEIRNFRPDSALVFGGGGGWNCYVGDLNDVAIWNRPLSVDEVFHTFVDQGGEPTLTTGANASPVEFLPFKNYFTPGSNNLTIRYNPHGSNDVSLSIFDHRGTSVRDLERGRAVDFDTYEAIWDGRNSKGSTVASGVYIVLLKTGAQAARTKVVAVK